MQRSLMMLRSAAPIQRTQILNRVAQLGLSSRAFSQARVVLSSAATTPKVEQKPEVAVAAASTVATVPAANSFSEVVERFGGWYPFVGLAAVIAVSKEVIILNEEFLLISNFVAMFATLYFGLGDTVTKAAEEQHAAIIKRQDEASDFEIEALQALIHAHELNIEQVNVLKRLKEENSTLATSLATAKGLKVRHAARDAVVKRLGDIRGREAAEQVSFRSDAINGATKFVQREFPLQNAATKSALIDFAISVVEGKATTLPAAQDPVKKLYEKYFGERIFVKELSDAKKAKQQQ